MRYLLSETAYIMGVFASGVVPRINIYKLLDNSLVVTTGICTEIAVNTGFYKYPFTPNPSVFTQYAWIMTASGLNQYGKLEFGGWVNTLQNYSISNSGVLATKASQTSVNTVDTVVDEIFAVTELIADYSDNINAYVTTYLNATISSRASQSSVDSISGMVDSLEEYTDDVETYLISISGMIDAISTEDYSTTLISISGMLATTQGLSQHNFRFYNQVFGDYGLTSGMIRIYPTADDCNDDTNQLKTYMVTTTYADGVISDHKVTEV